MKDETRLIRSGAAPKILARTVGPPVQKGSTVLLPSAAALYDDENFQTYGRQGLAAQAAFSDALATMEGAVGVALYPSGVAALSGAMLALLQAGDEVLVVDNIYAPTRRFCEKVLKRYGVTTRYFDPRIPPDVLVGGATPATKLIVLESPGSLTMEMQDLTAVAAAASKRGILTLADNTWGAGYLYKPLEYGIDVSVQSLTKYVGGHSDVFMGSAAARDPALVRRLEDGVMHMGWAVSGEDAYQMLRGLRTLPTRLARHAENAIIVAEHLAAHPLVSQVLYPALPDAPDHALWQRDYSGACGLFSIVLADGSRTAADAFLDALKLFGLGFSWGGFESLAILCDPQLGARSTCKTFDGPVIRLHVGLENPADLIADLDHALGVYEGALG